MVTESIASSTIFWTIGWASTGSSSCEAKRRVSLGSLASFVGRAHSQTRVRVGGYTKLCVGEGGLVLADIELGEEIDADFEP